jgi:cytochrome P450
MEDPNWADNPDYYAIELIMALAILSTVGNITVWLIRHILADPAVLQRILAQIDDLVSRGDGMSVDLSNLHEACPLLVASWFETLRLHMTGTPRMVVNDFQLNTGERLRAGDIVLLPQSEPNRDPATWVAPGRFLPDRFLDEQGRLVPSRTRKVKDFGVTGNLCPGRYFAFGLVMGLTVSVLATVDVQPGGDGGTWPEPRASTGVSGGFEQCVNDVAVRVTRKGKWVGQELPVSFARGLFRG